MGITTGFHDWGQLVFLRKQPQNGKKSPDGFMFAVESNRLVSIAKGTWVQVQKQEVPEDGMMVWPREFGNVKLFRTRLKDQLRHYVVFLAGTDAYDTFEQADFQKLHGSALAD